MSRAWKVANGVMLVAYLLSVAVQVNDPDPVLWMALYGVAAVACGLELRGRGGIGFPAGIAVITIAWAIHLSPRVLGVVPFGAMFGAWEMADTGIEESREMYGLLLIGLWMCVLAAAAYRRDRRSA